jgi:hypothetical protein
MAQNFVYTPEIAVQTVRQIGLEGSPKLGLRDFIFGRVFSLDSLIRKTSSKVDVLYVESFSGKVLMDFEDFSNNTCGMSQVHESSSHWVDASGFRVYAVDPMLNVRRWAKKFVLGEKNADSLGNRYASEVAEKYGKVVVLDSTPSESENGLFSFYFPSFKHGIVAGVVSRGEDSVSFEKNLTTVLETVRQQALG